MREDEQAARALVERARESGLRLDREGRWWHEGDPVRHAGLARALHRWIDLSPDGRPVLRLDERRFADFDCEDTPFVARSARREGASFALLLSDETEEALDPSTLRRRGDDLLCRVKQGRFAARLARQAVYALGDSLRDGPEGLVLESGGRTYAITP